MSTKNSPDVKLNFNQVTLINKMRFEENISLGKIGILFGVSKQRIALIVGKTGFLSRAECPVGSTKCYICKKIKKDEYFYKGNAPGSRNRCKYCLLIKSRKYGKLNYRNYNKGGKYYYQAKARTAVLMALKNGKLIKESCFINKDCSGRIEAHHHLGYEKENYLKVIWLCSKHHHEADVDRRVIITV